MSNPPGAFVRLPSDEAHTYFAIASILRLHRIRVSSTFSPVTRIPIERMYTIRELAELIGLHPASVYRMLDHLNVPTYQIGKRTYRVPESSLKKLIGMRNAGKVKPRQKRSAPGWVSTPRPVPKKKYRPRKAKGKKP